MSLRDRLKALFCGRRHVGFNGTLPQGFENHLAYMGANLGAIRHVFHGANIPFMVYCHVIHPDDRFDCRPTNRHEKFLINKTRSHINSNLQYLTKIKSCGGDSREGGWMLRRFYFDVDNGHGIVRDDEGVEAVDFEQALAAARSVISEMAAEMEVANLNGPCSIIVRDETGFTLAQVPLGLFSTPPQEPKI